MEDQRLFGLRLGYARQADLSSLAQVKPHLHHHDSSQTFQYPRWSQGSGKAPQFLFEINPQTVTQKGDHDMCLNPTVQPVPDGTYPQFTLEHAKGFLHFG